MRISYVVMAAAAALVLSGCPKKVDTLPETGESQATMTNTNTNPAGAQSSQGSSNMGNDAAALQELQRLGMIVYFDYDKAEIKSDYVAVVAAHAKFLNGNASRTVRLEGHTDERGSREYNIGLGERRAQAVRRALMLQGVQEGQIATISYGEERPAAPGGDEEAYGKNRRVELSYAR
ncbi:MAG TPA: peptidoglycan-associated lipoprotein Pal [Steroidobacteraceae bacterium]|nr:peptidoglycan-associated lipoprotein Pal [Steroidobacteraceae bacterium]